MSEQDRKRLLRETKRQIKKDGNRSRRRHLQRKLEDDPENAHLEEDYNYKHNSSTWLNGMDNDATLAKEKKITRKTNEILSKRFESSPD